MVVTNPRSNYFLKQASGCRIHFFQSFFVSSTYVSSSPTPARKKSETASLVHSGDDQRYAVQAELRQKRRWKIVYNQQFGYETVGGDRKIGDLLLRGGGSLMFQVLDGHWTGLCIFQMGLLHRSQDNRQKDILSGPAAPERLGRHLAVGLVTRGW